MPVRYSIKLPNAERLKVDIIICMIINCYFHPILNDLSPVVKLILQTYFKGVRSRKGVNEKTPTFSMNMYSSF